MTWWSLEKLQCENRLAFKMFSLSKEASWLLRLLNSELSIFIFAVFSCFPKNTMEIMSSIALFALEVFSLPQSSLFSCFFFSFVSFLDSRSGVLMSFTSFWQISFDSIFFVEFSSVFLQKSPIIFNGFRLFRSQCS